MKKKLLHIVTVVTLLSFPNINYAQAPALGTAANFVLFTSLGSVSNVGITHLTGNVGTNNGSSTGFGNVDGVMHDQDLASGQCMTDLLGAYNQLNSTTPIYFPSSLLGNGDTLKAGVYSITGSSTLSQTLYLNGQGNANAVFIFKLQGAFSSGSLSQIKLINGAKACNVFWKIEGLVSLASGTKMKGTVIVNNAAIVISAGVALEGRALSTNGSITTDGILAYTPIGCNSPILTGPTAPNLMSTACYALFSSNGPVTNTKITHANGDVGTNVGLTTGYSTLTVTGTIHPSPDGSTAACASDLLNVYTYLNTLPHDIELLYPTQFGNSLVLTPHTYLLNSGTAFTDTLFLNAEGNANAVFVIKINGAIATSTYAQVVLTNGALAKNVFWSINGAVDINNFSYLKGTIVCNNAAINLKNGVKIDGRALTTNGALTSDSVNVTISASACANVGIQSLNLNNSNESAVLYPNPMTSSLMVNINEVTELNSYELRLYNVIGSLMISKTLTEKATMIDTNFPSGIYFYKIINKSNIVQSGKLISQ